MTRRACYVLCAGDGLTRVTAGGVVVNVKHYVGFAQDLDYRVNQHLAGEGSCLTRAWFERGIPFVLARVFPGQGPIFERMIKHRKHFADICPNCNPATAYAVNLPIDLIPHPIPMWRTGRPKIAATMREIVDRVMYGNRSFKIRLTAIAADLRNHGADVYAPQIERAFYTKALADYKAESCGHGWHRITRRESE